MSHIVIKELNYFMNTVLEPFHYTWEQIPKLMNAMYVGGEEKHLNNFATLKGT